MKTAADSVTSLVSILIGIVGILLAIIFYFKGKKYKVIKYWIFSKTIIGDLNSRLEGLEVIYKGVKQKWVGVSTITIWNAGTETINSDEIVESRPLSIMVPSTVKILDVNIVNSTDESLGFNLKEIQTNHDQSAQILKIDFDYIDRKDGTIVQIVHDNGKGVRDIKVDCKIKGALPTHELGTFYAGMPDMPRFLPRKLSRLLRASGLMISVIFIIAIIIREFISKTPLGGNDIMGMILGAILVIFMLWAAWTDLRSITTEQIPTRLDEMVYRMYRKS